MQVVASNTVRASNDTEVTNTFTNQWESLNSFSPPVNGTGTYNLSWQYRCGFLVTDCDDGTEIANTKVQKNGIDITSVYTTQSMSYVDVNITITGLFNTSDIFELYIRKNASQYVYARNFRLSYNTSNVYTSDLNLSNGNLTVGISISPLVIIVSRNSSIITANDAGDTGGYWVIQNTTTTYNSIDYNLQNQTNTSSTLTGWWNTSAFNTLINLNIVDSNNIFINTTPYSIGSQIIQRFEFITPLLTDSDNTNAVVGFDYVVLNNSLSATDLNMYIPYIPTGGIDTRYATYDGDVYVSDRDDNYFIINISGTDNVTKSVRQSETILYNASSSVFSFGLIRDNVYPNFESNYSVSNGQVVYQNTTYIFNNKNQLLPDNNSWINTSRFSDVSQFPNSTVAQEARHMVENVAIGRFGTNWYPNGTRTQIWDGQTEYSGQLTSLSVYRMFQGLYYFAQPNLKNNLQSWVNAVETYNTDFQVQPYTRFESENYTDYSGRGWSLANSGGGNTYSGVGSGSAIYTTSQNSGEPLHFNFSGDMIRVDIPRHAGGSILNFSIDGGTNITIDGYYNSVPVVHTLYNLTVTPLSYDANPSNPSTWHTLTIYDTGTKNTSSGGYNAIIDYIEVRRNDSINQMVGYMFRQTFSAPWNSNYTLSYQGDGTYYNETVNISINNTIYPYYIQLFKTAEEHRGATSYVSMEEVMTVFNRWQVDSNNTWMAEQLPRLYNRMNWTYQFFYNSTYGLLYVPSWMGSSDWFDDMYVTGLSSVTNSEFVASADMLAQMYTTNGDTTNASLWIGRRDIVRNNMIKDVNNSGLFLNESIGGGHFILTKEPFVQVRYEVEEDDFLNKTTWTYYNDSATFNGSKISGRHNRQFNMSFQIPQERAIYYSTGQQPITWKFNGTGIDAIVFTDSTYEPNGIINVDGINYTINYSTPAITTAQVRKSINHSLQFGTHNVTIYSGTGGKNVAIDAFDIDNASVIGYSSYGSTPMTLNLFPSWYKNATVEFIYAHEGNYSYGVSGLRTDYLYPGLQNRNATYNIWSWGYLGSATGGIGFENAGHFLPSGAMTARMSGNYSDMQPYVALETGKYGVREWYFDNATSGDTSGAALETQMSGYFLTGYIPFLGTSYAQASDITPPASITSPATTTGNFYINNTWVNPVDADFDHIEFRNLTTNGLLTNLSNTTWNRTLAPHYTQNISAQTVDITGNVNTTKVWFNVTIPNNIPVLTNTTNQTVNEGAIVFLDINCTDADSDTCTFSNNQTNNFTDWSTSTGTGNWTTNLSSSGIYYINIGVTDGYGGQSNYTMTITVNNLYFIPPVPTMNSTIIGNFYVNTTWTAGAGNITNGYNVTINGAWSNSSNDYRNTSLSAHAWHNITVWAYNSTNSSLSLTSLTNNTQIPNNIPTLSNTTNQTVNEGNTVFIDIDGNDSDNDTLTFSNNRTDIFNDFNTSSGTGNWTTNYSSSGTTYVDIGITDNYGGQNNYTLAITINDINLGYVPPTPIINSTITGNFYVNTSWTAGAGNITNTYNVSTNGAWTNGSSNAYHNSSLSAHAWHNITIWAFNNTGNNLSLTSLTNNTQIPNNNLTQVSIGAKTVNEGDWLNFTVSSSDLDLDTMTYGTNATNGTFSTSNGNFNWSTNSSSSGIYYWYYNSSDGYGSTGNETVMITVNDVTIDNPPNITGWSNTNTSNNTLTFTVQQNTNVTFNITINQTVTTTWGGTASPTKINGTNENVSYAYKNFTTIGTFTVIPSCTNVNGTCTNIPTWTIIVNGTVTTYNISGYISNTLGAYLKDARVDFNNSFTLTDANGYYSFSSVNEGEYTTLARAIGYRNSTNSTEINSNTTINFTLNERKVSQVVSTPGFEIIISLITMITIYIMIRKRKNINNKKKI